MDDWTASSQRASDRGLSTPATFLLAAVALGVVVAGLHFVPAQTGTPAYAEGVTPTAEPTPNLAEVPNPPRPPLTNSSELTPQEVRYVQNWTFYYLNQERIRRGLDPLVRHRGLDLVARNRSYDMAVRGYFSHVDPKGGLAYEREFEKAGITDCSTYGENIGVYTYRLSKEDPKTKKQLSRHVVRGFMYSTPHRRSILDNRHQSVGVGVFSNNQIIYATMIFCYFNVIEGSRYYSHSVTPAVKNTEWIPKEAKKEPPYIYYNNGYETTKEPNYLPEVDTLTPIPNSSSSDG